MKRTNHFVFLMTIIPIAFLLLLPISAVSATDSTPPVLNEFTVSATTAIPGDTILLSASVSDEGSGTENVFLRYEAKGSAGKSVFLKYNTETEKYEGSFTFDDYDVEGVWKIFSISVEDKQSNHRSYYNYSQEKEIGNSIYTDLSEYNIMVTNPNGDSTPPVLNNFYISATEAMGGDTIHLSADVTEEGSGTEYVFVSYETPEGSIGKSIYLTYNNDTGKYEASLKFNENDMIGVWRIHVIGVSDYQSNHRTYINSDREEEIAHFLFTDLNRYNINVSLRDEKAPSTIIKIDPNEPNKNEWYSSEVSVSFEAEDSETGVESTFYKVGNEEWKKFNEPFVITKEGETAIQYYSVDKAGNKEETKPAIIKIDKMAPNLEVSFDHTVINQRDHKFIPITASVNASDALSGLGGFELVSIVSNQADNEKGDGNTEQDIQGHETGTADTEFQVRAETAKNQPRIYTITYEATDLAGNSTIVSEDIVVNANKSKENK